LDGIKKEHSNFDAISRATGQKLFSKSPIPLIFKITILILIILSISGFGVWYDGYSSDNNYILLIDSSGSMLADDYVPNRLEAAKKAATIFVGALNSDVEIGIISFAGSSFLRQSLTNDRMMVSNSVKDIEAINVGGTATGDAIILATNTFKISDSGGRGRSIILLTDGQSNVGISLQDAIDYAVVNGIVINSLGIGTEEGGSFYESGAISQLDPAVLEKLAKDTGGKFYLTRDGDELNQAYAEILSESKSRVFFDARDYLILLAFSLLLIEWILTNTRYKTII